MGGAIDGARDQQVELLPGLYAAATPSGMVSREAAEEILNGLVQSVPQNMDGLLLLLHGAMVSEQYPDMEGEILARIREAVGPDRKSVV